MDLNAAAIASLTTAYSAVFNERLTDTPTTWSRIAMRVPSSTRTQTYPKMAEIGPMREWVGERYIERLEQTAFSITNRKFEKTIAVSRDDIADDQYGIYRPIVADMGQVAAELPDELVWETLALGFTTTHYDGQFFFDTDHPVEDEAGAVQSVANYQAGSSSAWFLVDTTRMIKPVIFQDREGPEFVAKTMVTDDNVFKHDEYLWGTRRRCAAGFGAWQLAYASKAALTPTNYALAREAMLKMRGHRGRKLNLRPNLLVVAPANEAAAREILMAERDAAGATNIWRNTAEVHVETRLT